ncbi:(2Fe-2S)-binding protein [Desulfallas sp. Bu1-1]|uniref:(2Fe-2S)-binding protein n=1 Tax=Desulfallas sp. Bu1-1 TaxID=2787620 RepID=UPI00189DC8EC|nr:(2Fe-2S)-binding protein [Desulfallas sp. Bu1-1]MBF7084450.1 (2Fe-2S)-binding protein [Desulfallas sp. Bu1-1]
MAGKKHKIKFLLNGTEQAMEVEPNSTLLRTLRDGLGLTGTKCGCDNGECGACTVLIDGKAVLSCLTLTVEVDGKEVTTIEGLAQGTTLHPVQQAFIDHHGTQCGFCTPGIIMSSVSLLNENPQPTEMDVKKALVGNLCRCGSYPMAVNAVLQAAGKNRGGEK